jgi:hypothetical protein
MASQHPPPLRLPGRSSSYSAFNMVPRHLSMGDYLHPVCTTCFTRGIHMVCKPHYSNMNCKAQHTSDDSMTQCITPHPGSVHSEYGSWQPSRADSIANTCIPTTSVHPPDGPYLHHVPRHPANVPSR